MADKKPAGYRRVLRVRDFRLLVSAFVVDAIGGWAFNVVLIVYIYDRTGSPAYIAATTASSWIPRLLASSYAGAFADRYERRRVMMVSALVSAVVMAALTVAVAMDAPVLLLLGLSAAAAVTVTPYRPAASGLLPDLVKETDLVAANGLFGTLESLVVVLGPALGGLLLLVADPAVGIGVNASSFVLAALVVRSIRTTSLAEQPDEPESLTAQVVDGVRALRAEPVALALVLFCALDSAVYGASTVLWVPISQQVGGDASGYSYLLAGQALGGVLLAGFVDRLSGSGRLTAAIVGGMLALSLPTALTVFAQTPAVAFALQVIAGAGMVMVDVLAITALQRDLPKKVLGRVFGVLDTAVLVGTVGASLLTSLLLRHASLHTTLLIVGLGFAAATLVGVPALMSADRRSVHELASLAPRIARLQELDLFAGASQSAFAQLARAVEEHELTPGTVLIRQGEQADAMWVVTNGEVLVTATGANGTEQVLSTIEDGGYVGEIGLLHATPRTATVTVTAPTTAWRISGSDFTSALEASAPSAALLDVVGGRLRQNGGAPLVKVVQP